MKLQSTFSKSCALVLILSATLCAQHASDSSENRDNANATGPTIFENESRISNLRQLTDGGENAEAYFSYDASQLIYQTTIGGHKCDEIFIMNADGSNVRRISSGAGVTTCAFIAPDNKSVIYASTHLGGEDCPPKPDHSQGYVWALYKDYDIFAADIDGSNLRRLTTTEGYDAEAVYSPQGDNIIFTSARDGDLELYLMDPDGSNQRRLTNTPGYDGGAFFSYDGKKIVWRASRPTGDELADYQSLLKQGLIRPSKLEIFIADVDGSNVEQLTNPYWHPSGDYIVFASNMNAPRGRDFDLYTVNVKTKEIEQITFNPTFDGFPMFAHDGKTLVFASNRNNKERGETNVFICDWKH
jgi:Tol biopolymer transport system component